MLMRHNINSAAQEAGIPGTLNLKAHENEETGYGQALFPVPSLDPNDPLQWSWAKKHTILVICILYSFLGCSALFGVAPYIMLFSTTFNIAPTAAAALINYPSLAYGFSSLIFVPLYHKIGRRPVMLMSMLMYATGLLGASQSKTYTALMVSRIVQALGSGVCEALPVQLINDIFFIHERGSKLGLTVVSLSFGAAGPLYAGYMLAAGYSWRLFFYVNLAFAVPLLLATFFLVEETRFTRQSFMSKDLVQQQQVSMQESKKTPNVEVEEIGASHLPTRKTAMSRLKPWSSIDHEAPFFSMIARAFAYLLVPSNVWVITSYGCFIGLCGLAFNYTFPIKIVAAPYNWPVTQSGTLSIAFIVGNLLALPFSSVSDRLAAYLTRHNNGVREAEMRLGALLPAMVITPAGLVLFGLAAAKNLHWSLYFVGCAVNTFGGYFYFTCTLAYAMDSYTANLSELLIIQNIGKTAISFGAGYKVLDWITRYGYVRVIAGAFAGVLMVNNLMVFVFMVWGKRLRVMTSQSWLARLHARTAVVGEIH